MIPSLLPSPVGLAVIQALNPAAWFRYGIAISTTAWNDQSGNGRNISFTGSPTVDANGVAFDGATQYGQAAGYTIPQPYMMYAIMKQVAYSSTSPMWDGQGSIGRLRQGAVSGRIQFIAPTAGSPVLTDDLGIGTWGIVSVAANGASSSIQINNGTITTGDAGANGLVGLSLATNNVIGAFGAVAFKEVIEFSGSHSTATRARVVRYLASVAGLSV